MTLAQTLAVAFAATATFALAPSAQAQVRLAGAASPALAPGSSADTRRGAVELNVLWPFIPGVGIYQGRGTAELWKTAGIRGDAVVALNLRPPVDAADEGAFSEYGGGLGYRQYFWRGLHVELALYPTYARLEDNVVDGKTYQSFALTLEAYAGYRTLLSELGVASAASWPLEPLVNVQLGVGRNAYLSNPWPTRREDAPLFFVGSVLVGAAF